MATIEAPAAPPRRPVNIFHVPEPDRWPELPSVENLVQMRAEVLRLQAEIDAVLAALKAGYP